jgi:dolichol-phosphate mannosyltransferase
MIKPIFSLILPVFNEEETLEETYRRVAAVVDKLDGEGEIIMVDDGSRDHSLQMMRELRQRDPRLRYLSLARNFGHQIAVTAGLRFAQGDAVIVLDSDLQDPPELIPTMIAKWREGYHVVYAQRTARHREGPLKKTLRLFLLSLFAVTHQCRYPS